MAYPEVVRVFATTQEPDFDSPWQTRSPSSSTGSGVVIAGNQLTVTLSGAAANSCFTLTLNGISDIAGNPLGATAVSARVLKGDRTADGVVNIVDLNEVKGDLFQSLDDNNFTSDINTDGVVNIVDLNDTKGNLFSTASCP